MLRLIVYQNESNFTSFSLMLVISTLALINTSQHKLPQVFVYFYIYI